MLALRAALEPEEVRERSAAIQKRLLESEVWAKAGGAALYMPVRGEVETGRLVEAALEQGKKLYLPRCLPDRPGEMVFAACGGLEDCRPGSYGILEPDPATCPYCIFSESKYNDPGSPIPDLFILPGLAFDLRGFRLGFGGGYYDRFLAGLKAGSAKKPPFFAALAYSFQVIDEVPADPWDRPMDLLCTEEKMLWIK